MYSLCFLALLLCSGLVFPASGVVDSDGTEASLRRVVMPVSTKTLYTAGEKTTFSCTTDTVGAVGSIQFNWTANGNPIQNASIERYDAKAKTESRITFRVAKYLNEAVLKCEAYNGVGDSQAQNTTLHVQYPPHVSVKVTYGQELISTECTAIGNPNNFTFQTHYSVMGDSPSLASNNSSILELNNLTYEDTGYFHCSVSNGIGVAQTNSTMVEPRTKAVFVSTNNTYEVTTGSNLEIVFDFYARPLVSRVELNVDLDNIEKPLQLVNVSVKLKAGTFDLAGQRARIILENVTLEDSGNYSIIARNGQGPSTVFFKILVQEFKEVPPTTGPVQSGGIGAGIIILVLVILLNMLVLGALLYRRYRKMKPKRFVAKVHGDTPDTSKFLAGPDGVEAAQGNPIFRPKQTSAKPRSNNGHGCYAELDFSHLMKDGKTDGVRQRAEPATEYAYIDFTREPPDSVTEPSPPAS